jgi:hypothetical protein
MNAERLAQQYIENRKKVWADSYDKAFLMRLFWMYEQGASYRDMSAALNINAHAVGVALGRVGLAPHRQRIKSKTDVKLADMIRAHHEGAQFRDIAGYCRGNKEEISNRLSRIGLQDHRPLLRTGKGKLGYLDASNIYRLSDAQYTVASIRKVLRNCLVEEAIERRPEIAPKAVAILKALYPRAPISTPYLVSR